MKIDCTDGSTIDTDKLNDLSAELHERVAQFHEFCKRHRIPMFLRFVDPVQKGPEGRTLTGGATHWEGQEEFINVLTSIDVFFAIETRGQIRLMMAGSDQSPPPPVSP